MRLEKRDFLELRMKNEELGIIRKKLNNRLKILEVCRYCEHEN